MNGRFETALERLRKLMNYYNKLHIGNCYKKKDIDPYYREIPIGIVNLRSFTRTELFILSLNEFFEAFS